MNNNATPSFWPAFLLVLCAIGIGAYLLYQISPLAVLLWCAGWLIAHYYHQYQLLKWAQNNRFSSEGFGTWGRIFRQIARQSRKQTQLIAAQKERIGNLDSYLYLLPDGVAIIDPHFSLEWMNEVFAQHLGIRTQEDLGIRLTHLARNPDLIKYFQAGDFSSELEFTFYGRTLMLLVIRLDTEKYFVVTQDRSAQKNLERLRRDFIANSSHELRTPLTVIHGFLALAMQSENQSIETLRANLPLMYRESQRMMRLIEDMQTLSALEREGIEAIDKRDVISLTNVVTQSLSGAQQLVKQLPESYRFVQQGEDVLLRIPETLLHSVINNLIVNAVRYSPQGGTITVSWMVENSGLSVHVHDQGLGIAAEHIGRLTERFYRVDEGYSRQVQGTGLGLAIVKHTMQRLNGRLEIESVLGQGSRFSLYFPTERIVSDSYSDKASSPAYID